MYIRDTQIDHSVADKSSRPFWGDYMVTSRVIFALATYHSVCDSSVKDGWWIISFLFHVFMLVLSRKSCLTSVQTSDGRLLIDGHIVFFLYFIYIYMYILNRNYIFAHIQRAKNCVAIQVSCCRVWNQTNLALSSFAISTSIVIYNARSQRDAWNKIAFRCCLD